LNSLCLAGFSFTTTEAALACDGFIALVCTCFKPDHPLDTEITRTLGPITNRRSHFLSVRKAMRRYRAYTVLENCHFIAFRAFVCSSDEDAIVWAKHLLE